MGRSAESVMNGSKSGLLYKQGHKVKNWKRRWFSLCGAATFVFVFVFDFVFVLFFDSGCAEKRLYYFEPAHSGVRPSFFCFA